MKIYAVKPDTDYRLMFPEDDVYDMDEWEFKGESLVGKLPKQFTAYFKEGSDKPLPDIAWIGMLTFAFRRDVAGELSEILEAAGELLPFTVDGEIWYCYNVLTSTEALDPDKCDYEIVQGNTRMGLKSYAFDPARLPESSLFKIPQDNHTTMFCVDRRENDEQVLGNFFCAVAAHGYTGVKFEEVFSDEG